MDYLQKNNVPDVVSLMTPLVIDIGLPSMVLFNILTKFDISQIRELLIYPFSWIIEIVFFFIMAYCLQFISKEKYRREFFITLFFQNGIFLPLIIITEMYSAESKYLLYLFLFTMFYPVLFFNTYILFFKTKNNFKVGINQIINPVLIVTIVGLIIKIFSIDKNIPLFFYSILKKVGAMTIPLLMIIIGGNIYMDLKKNFKLQYYKEILKFIVAKNFIFPFIIIMLLVFFNIKKELALILFLESVVPPITAIPIFVERAGGNKNIANQYLVSSFLASLISIPIFYSIFKIIKKLFFFLFSIIIIL